MASQPKHEKIKLGQNHRRAVSAVLREIESLCITVEQWVDRQGGLFLVPEEDLAPGQKAGLRRLVGELRAELQQCDNLMTLDHSRQSRRRALAALLSTAVADLEDTDASRLRSYGPLTKEAAARIDERMQRLIAVLDQMTQVTLRDSTAPPHLPPD